MPERVLIVVADLMFQPRIRDAVAALGLEARVADTPADIDRELPGDVALAIVDLNIAGIDAIGAVARAKAAGAGVLAFGRHTEPALLRAAREAGADRVVPRSQLVEELAELISGLVGAGEAAGRE